MYRYKSHGIKLQILYWQGSPKWLVFKYHENLEILSRNNVGSTLLYCKSKHKQSIKIKNVQDSKLGERSTKAIQFRIKLTINLSYWIRGVGFQLTQIKDRFSGQITPQHKLINLNIPGWFYFNRMIDHYDCQDDESLSFT